ncbi:Arabinogalactan peptide 23 [Cucumis melo var. makuwa]|uniref:Arabinogalactan peptide 23 n=1 Tax=Cucumis melo var. makuwa TaxID=1194695 RepID=A0A5D3DQ83_CUCMM|nr:Arabinogalactan peptide 23 [Cucumis melo var. makuwa]TYK25430.1 Arabinogalactan peptide 23 [Cucumis melo var. makuwa]
MDMKKVTCAVLVAAAAVSATMATSEGPAPAPSLSSDATAALPAVGAFIGASLVSFFAYYL